MKTIGHSITCLPALIPLILCGAGLLGGPTRIFGEAALDGAMGGVPRATVAGEPDPIPATATVVGSLPFPPGAGERMFGLGYEEGANALWATSQEPDAIFRLDAATGAVLARFPVLSGSPRDTTWDGVSVWMMDFWANTFFELDPETGAVLSSCTPPGPPPSAGGASGVASDGTSYFLVNKAADAILRLDSQCGVLNVTTFSGGGASGLGFDHAHRALFVLDANGRLYVADPRSGRDLCPSVDLGSGSVIRGAAFDGRYLWIVNNASRTLQQIDVCIPHVLLFIDGFESGDTSAWSATAP